MSNVYLISDGELIKIGKANDINVRISQLQTGNASTLRPLGYIRCSSSVSALNVEKSIHHALKRNNVRGEWFSTSVRDIEALGYNVELGEYEPDFVKVYCEATTMLNGLPTSARAVLTELLLLAKDNNEIGLTAVFKRRISEATGFSVKTIDNRLQDLLKSGIISRIDTGTFMLNPYLFGKGDWKTINELRNKNIHLSIVYDKETGMRSIRGNLA